jgi:hypothetical protein
VHPIVRIVGLICAKSRYYATTTSFFAKKVGNFRNFLEYLVHPELSWCCCNVLLAQTLKRLIIVLSSAAGASQNWHTDRIAAHRLTPSIDGSSLVIHLAGRTAGPHSVYAVQPSPNPATDEVNLRHEARIARARARRRAIINQCVLRHL